jgi:hypothetical protein
MASRRMHGKNTSEKAKGQNEITAFIFSGFEMGLHVDLSDYPDAKAMPKYRPQILRNRRFREMDFDPIKKHYF